MSKKTHKTETSKPSPETIEQVRDAYYNANAGLEILKSILGNEEFFGGKCPITKEESAALNAILGEAATQNALIKIKAAYDAIEDLDLSKIWMKS